MTSSPETEHASRPRARFDLSHLRDSKAAAYVGPFLVFLVLLQLIQWIKTDREDASWWLAQPEHWGYPFQAIVCLGLLWFWRRHYPIISGRGFGLAFLGGIIGIAIWLLPPLLHSRFGLGSEEMLPWLRWLGFRERLEGFNPFLFGEQTSLPLLVLIVGLRFLRLVVAVSFVEEIFWRGFLMRFLTDPDADWKTTSLKQCSAKSIGLTAIAFALVHLGPDTAVALVYGALVGWVTVKTGNLYAAIFMHAVSNLILGMFILMSGWWGLW
ncbi:MAG: CAAX prenyl protease-related protein [Verrucomicrobiota bacterium]